MPKPFHRVGHGPHAVLVLHGWFGDARSFEPIEAWLSQDKFSYVFVDYRGYGERRDTRGAYTIDEIAADALALADALGFRTFSLVGHSMGGMAIEKIAACAPERVRSLVPVAPVPCGGIAFDAERRALFEGAAERPGNRRAIIDRSTGGRLPSSWVEWKAAYSASHSSPEAFAAYFHAWADTDFGDEIAGRHPVKVLVGEHDPTFNAALMARTYLRRYPLATVDVLANAGHYPMNETPLALVAAIESFLLASDESGMPNEHDVLFGTLADGETHMKKSESQQQNVQSPSQLIDARIEALGDWRGEMLGRLRALVKEADPDVVEEWKWRGVPVWSDAGILCTGETYKSVVKMTFAKGAALPDPAGLFNASLEGNTRRAIDFREGEAINERALKTLVRDAVALNRSKATR